MTEDLNPRANRLLVGGEVRDEGTARNPDRPSNLHVANSILAAIGLGTRLLSDVIALTKTNLVIMISGGW